MNDLTRKINLSINKICVFNNNIAKIEIDEYVKIKLNKDNNEDKELVFYINEYNMLFNN
jgi:hypothetical protein